MTWISNPDSSRLPARANLAEGNIVRSFTGCGGLSNANEIYNLAFTQSSGTNRSGHHMRQVLPTYTLAAAKSGAGMIRVTIRTGTLASAATLDHAWVGESGVTEPNFDGNQVKLTFAGLDTAGPFTGIQTVVSDPIQFDYNPCKKLVVSMHWSGTDYRGQFRSGGANAVQDAKFYTILFADTQTGDTIPANPPVLQLSNQSTIDFIEMLPPSAGWINPANQSFVNAIHYPFSRWLQDDGITDGFTPPRVGVQFMMVDKPDDRVIFWREAGRVALQSTTSPVQPRAPPAATLTPSILFGSLLGEQPRLPDYKAALFPSVISNVFIPPVTAVTPPWVASPLDPLPIAPNYRAALAPQRSWALSLPAAILAPAASGDLPLRPDYKVALTSTTSPVLVSPPFPFVPTPSAFTQPDADDKPRAPDYRAVLAPSVTNPIFIPPVTVAVLPRVTSPLDPLPQAKDYRTALSQSVVLPVFLPTQTPSSLFQSPLDPLPLGRDYSRVLASTSGISLCPNVPSAPAAVTPSSFFASPLDPLPLAKDYSRAIASTSGIALCPIIPIAPTPAIFFASPLDPLPVARDYRAALAQPAAGPATPSAAFLAPPTTLEDDRPRVASYAAALAPSVINPIFIPVTGAQTPSTWFQSPLDPLPTAKNYSTALSAPSAVLVAPVIAPVLTPSALTRSIFGELPIPKDYRVALESTTHPAWGGDGEIISTFCPNGQHWLWNDAQWGCGLWATTPEPMFSRIQEEVPRAKDYRVTLGATTRPAMIEEPILPILTPSRWFGPLTPEPLRPDYSKVLASTTSPVRPNKLPPADPAISTTPSTWFGPVTPAPLRPDYSTVLASTTSPVRPNLLPPSGPAIAPTPSIWFDQCLDEPLPTAKDHRIALSAPAMVLAPPVVVVQTQTPSAMAGYFLGDLPIPPDYKAAISSTTSPVLIPPPFPPVCPSGQHWQWNEAQWDCGIWATTPAEMFSKVQEDVPRAKDYLVTIRSTTRPVMVELAPANPIIAATPSTWFQSPLDPLPGAKDYKTSLSSTTRPRLTPQIPPPPASTPTLWFMAPVQPQRMAKDYGAALASTSGVARPILQPPPSPAPVPPRVCYTTFVAGGASGVTMFAAGTVGSAVVFGARGTAIVTSLPPAAAASVTAFTGTISGAPVVLTPNPSCP